MKCSCLLFFSLLSCFCAIAQTQPPQSESSSGEKKSDSIRDAKIQQKRAEILWTRVLCKEKGRYIGWPSICRRAKNGELLVVFSGDRDQHICPWGKVQMIRSMDNGVTWSAPKTICNTQLDDRDAGITELANGDLLVVWFNSVAYSGSFCRNPEKWKPGSRQYAYCMHDEKLPMEVKEKEFGFFSARSTDGGKTWEPRVRMYGSANHGAIQLKDGRLLMVGRRWNGNNANSIPSMKNVRHELPVEESTDNGRSWHVIARITPTPPDSISQFHEPHVVETADGRLVAQFRCHHSSHNLRQAESADGGKTWSPMITLPIRGFPPHLIRLSDNTLLTVYAKRTAPYGEYACLSDDHGRTWDVTNEIKLCGHFNGDLGYPASVQLPGGNILTIYYQADKKGEMPCLMGTLWKVKK